MAADAPHEPTVAVQQRRECRTVAPVREMLEQLGVGAGIVGVRLDQAVHVAKQRVGRRTGHRYRPPSGPLPMVVQAAGKRVWKFELLPTEPRSPLAISISAPTGFTCSLFLTS